MEILFICFIAVVAIVLVRVQIWHSSYIREKKKEEKDVSMYVMNLEEQEECRLKQQGFISFLRFLFLLSITTSFIKEVWVGFIVKFKVAKKEVMNNVMYKVIRSSKD